MKDRAQSWKSRTTAFRVSGWIVTCLVAGAVGAWSYSVANQARTPGQVFALGLPAYTGDPGSLALASLAARRQKNVKAAVTPLERSLALKAYRRDPLAVSSIGILALAAGEPAERQKMLELAGRLSRRSSFVSYELIQTAAARGEEQLFFTWLSRAALTNSDARKVYIAAMADATGRPNALEGLLPVIGPNPSWTLYYWNAVNQRPAGLKNGALLRIALTREPWRQNRMKSTDPTLVRQLVAHNDFDTAHALVDALTPGRSSRADGNLLVNADFSKPAALAPFDWALASSGNLGASIDVRQQRLLISAIPGAYGKVARQLVRLDAGTYEFRWKLSSSAAIPENGLTVGLRCASSEQKNFAQPENLAVGEHRHIFVVPAKSNCEWYWLTIDASIPDDGAGFDVQLAPVRLTKITGASVSAASPVE